ncbi:hypothetical protein WICMUC_001904 [Wickerhamomyces mucosus]|uniref:N2227-domain-containing protein n=1 Tax=Wickerhamomyces mucosus TaxID=1378264 RepID=A0A9P8TFR5_9ASCO|nr:hypothetical protein WICMUC_001904 [Wickerhamomyces mucosus]
MSSQSTVSPDIQLILTRLSLLLVIYAAGLVIAPSSQLPLLVFCVGMASTFYRTNSFKWLIDKFVKLDMTSERQDIVNAIASLKRYETLALAWNNHKTRTFKRVSWEDQKQAREIGYYDHLMSVNQAIHDNGALCQRIVKEAIKKHGISELELKSSLYSKANSRVIEAICHYARDWTELGDGELKPLLSYIIENLDRNISVEDRSKTVLIIPGSGLGRIAHELSSLTPQFKSVQAVEFSSLMHLCNEFIYSEPQTESFQLHPYVHTYSHHITKANHTRSITLKKQPTKPSNLTLNFKDFRKFNLPESIEYDNVVIVTAFFLDTAQNLFEYFASIERLIGSKTGLWINIGPLKYGTAPVVEFSLEELRHLRKIRGWKDIDEPKPYGEEISGYLTDVKGLWQGYYGLGRWTSKYSENRKNY